MPLSAFEPVNRRDMAGLFGIPLRRFTELETRGVVTPISRGRGHAETLYDVRDTLRAYLAWRAREPARDRLFRLQGDRVALEVKVREGQLLDAVEVDREWATIATG